ncbi:MAG: response regulator [Acidobacteriota bacterium]|nr:response regulator [Acidobacteriota bacterium]
MRVVIVDDESIARRQLKLYLKQHEDVEIVGEAECGLAGVEAINALQPDVVFLDVEMPDINGFEILPYLKVKPIVVFCSSFDRYAVKAFEVPALDYLLKPVNPERLALALWRVRERLQPPDVDVPEPNVLKKLIARGRNEYRIIWINNCMLFQKSGRYTQVQLDSGETHLIELTLDYLEEHMPKREFFRISRQAMVRRSLIQAMRPGNTAGGEIETPEGETLQVSRARWKAFKEWFFNAG